MLPNNCARHHGCVRVTFALLLAIAASCWFSLAEGQAMEQAKESHSVEEAVAPVAKHELANAAYRLAVECVMDKVEVTLDDKQMGFRVAEGPCVYRAQRRNDKQAVTYRGLEGVTVDVAGSRLTIRGKLAGLDVEHTFDLPADRPIMEERIAVHNGSDSPVALSEFEVGFVRPITDNAGKVLPELAGDRFVAVPFRAKPDDVKPTYNDFSTADLIDKKGYEIRVKFDLEVRTRACRPATVGRLGMDPRPAYAGHLQVRPGKYAMERFGDG